MIPITERQALPYVQVSYLRIEIDPERFSGARADGSGHLRMWLHEVPKWLMQNPGTLVVRIEEI